MDLTERVQVENQHASMSLDPDRCRRILLNVLAGEKARLEVLTVILTDHTTVRELNRSYLGHDYDTDVLAFSYGEGAAVDGEIYIDLDTASERHLEFGAAFEEEVLRYAVHGLLHLVGHTDKNEEGKERMRNLEERYLRDAGS